MTWRGGVAVALLLAVGLVAGYAASATWSAQAPASGEPARPLPAQPELPSDPAPVVNPDPEDPPLSTDLDYHYETLGTDGFGVDVPVPDGWSRTISEALERKWKAKGNPSFTYVLRVERVAGQTKTIPSILAERIVGLDADPKITDLHVNQRDQHSLAYDYVFAGYRRYAYITWVDVSGSGHAEVEVAVNGREVDIDGLRALVDHVSNGLRPATP